MANTPEGKIKDAVKKILKSHGCWYFMPVSNGMGKHGIPDIIACMPVTVTQDMVGTQLGLFTAVETKAPGKLKNVTPLQQRCIDEINDCGGTAFATDDPKKVEELWQT